MWQQLETLSVLASIRSVALVRLSISDLCRSSHRWRHLGLAAIPLGLFRKPTSYASRIQTTETTGNAMLSVAVGRYDLAAQFADAWERADDASMGQLLGYPECCVRFFCQFWIIDKLLDPTLSAAARTVGKWSQRIELALPSDGLTSVAWRWLGVRSVFHLPCSLNCEATREVGRQLRSLMIRLERGTEAEWLRQLLAAPFEYSSLHGIAITRTPICKWTHSTDALGTRFDVLGLSSEPWLDGSASGRGHMYRPVAVPAAPTPNLPGPGQIAHEYNSDQNGFPTAWLMRRAHARVLAVVDPRAIESNDSVLDLGCGNGALLAAIVRESGAQAFGVEQNLTRAAAAKERLQVNGDALQTSSIWEYRSARTFGTALISVARLEEYRTFRAYLGRCILARRWVIYDYSGKLVERAEVLGIRLDGVVDNHAGLVVDWGHNA
ncbi:MAG: hypothetical protein IPJ34_33655 [Myxococcales bacterium]|nr:hypothetical protein [Myxococcales bacterium]